MGTGFTIDTPLKVARYGITSALSLLDDVLIEQMRKYHCELLGEPYEPIEAAEHDSRARRITAYLNMMGRVIERQVAELRAAPFEPGSEITRYFELLPDCPEQQLYQQMLTETDETARARMQGELREMIVPGRIETNLMTKADVPAYIGGVEQPPEFAMGRSALRGFALSDIEGGIVFSSGLNPRLYSYCAEFEDFFAGPDGLPRKEIILKVSDYRSALIQGKYLAKLGIWVAEYRVESGVNCGGHAFTAKGQLLGPTLAEFMSRREELHGELASVYHKALAKRDGAHVPDELKFRITAQGGITSAQENSDLMELYAIDGTGWGTPFLLVPEATNVDAAHLRKLAKARERDVWLSNTSPMGVPFWTLRNSDAELRRKANIRRGKPGSPCVKKFVAINTEFGEKPLCVASRTYQKAKLEELDSLGLPRAEYNSRRADIVAKSCICHDLAGGATLKLGIDNRATPAVCCGPSIARFNRVYSLEELMGHAYGRVDLFAGKRWPHMFLQELRLSIDALRVDLRRLRQGLADSEPKKLIEMREHLSQQVDYYRQISRKVSTHRKTALVRQLNALASRLRKLPLTRSLARSAVRIR